MEDMIRLLAAELGQKPQHVEAVVRLLDEGNTIPFIARYRKEQHGAMDDTTLRAHWQSACSICAIWPSAVRRSAAPSPRRRS